MIMVSDHQSPIIESTISSLYFLSFLIYVHHFELKIFFSRFLFFNFFFTPKQYMVQTTNLSKVAKHINYHKIQVIFHRQYLKRYSKMPALHKAVMHYLKEFYAVIQNRLFLGHEKAHHFSRPTNIK